MVRGHDARRAHPDFDTTLRVEGSLVRPTPPRRARFDSATPER
jgi:hypothetical protein